MRTWIEDATRNLLALTLLCLAPMGCGADLDDGSEIENEAPGSIEVASHNQISTGCDFRRPNCGPQCRTDFLGGQWRRAYWPFGPNPVRSRMSCTPVGCHMERC